MLAESSPLFFERYELKYQIPESLLEPICAWIEPFCEMDYYSEVSLKNGGDGFYPISNLYLDTPNNQFLERKLLGMNDAISMRVRSYGDVPKVPYFLELKHNHSGIKKKFRTKINRDDWADLISYDKTIDDFPELKPHDSNRDLFLRVAWQNRVEPKVLTAYRRRAYASTINQYARVTFDKDMRYFHRNPWEWTLDRDPKRMVNYDNELRFDQPEYSIVMELKSTVEVPLWFLDLISAFRLDQGGFSKYGSSMEEILPLNRRQITRMPAHGFDLR